MTYNSNLNLPPESDSTNISQEKQPSSDSYENRAVVFLDILGFKELISKSKTHPELISILADVLGSSKNSSTDKFFERFKIDDNAKNIDDRLTTFSDFFAMSVPCNQTELSKDDATNVAILIYATFIQYRALMLNGFLSLGGIAVGNVYHIDTTHNRASNILFGNAFNEAYLLESQFANIPRVILSNALRKLIYKYCNKSENKDCEIKKFFDRYIRRAPDGPAYIDMFADFIYDPKINQEDVIKIKENLCALLDEETDKPSIFSKVIAISQLFNNAIEKSEFQNDLKISQELLPLN